MRLAFLGLLTLWCVLPFLRFGKPAQDAVIVIAAGSLAHDAPGAIYPTHGRDDVSAPLAERFCSAYPTRQSCEPVLTPYTNPPPLLPVAWALAQLPLNVSQLLVRLASALALAAAFELLWQAIAPAEEDALLVTLLTLLCTPLALGVVEVGQNSSFLLLAAVGGIMGTRASRLTTVAAAVSAVFKGFPLVAVALWAGFTRRFGRLITVVISLSVLTVSAMALSGPRILADFAAGARSMSGGTGYHQDTSIESMLERLVGPAPVLAWVLRAGLLALGVALLRRCRTPEARWAVAWLFVTLAMPKVWPNYLWLALPAYIALARERGERLDLRPLLAIGVCLLILGLVDSRNAALLPWLQPPTLVVIGWALHRARRARQPALGTLGGAGAGAGSAGS
jgi:Glycosyltransferase family 87